MPLKKLLPAAFSIAVFSCVPVSTAAQIKEVRIGITEFDHRDIALLPTVGPANENSIAINGEILFDEPQFLKWALSPQPYIGATINLEGKTSYGGAGLLWRQGFGEKIYGDFALGLVAHTGTTEIRRRGRESLASILPRFDEEIQFGSRILFREQIALGYNVNKDWSAEIFYEHLSNGGLAERNDGVNNIGFRAAKKF